MEPLFQKNSKERNDMLGALFDEILEQGKKPDPAAEGPPWVIKGRLNEAEFVEHYLQGKTIRCINGNLYNEYGLMDERKLAKDMYDEISVYKKSGLPDAIARSINTLKIRTYTPEPKPNSSEIFFKNGTYDVKTGEFTEGLKFCMNRLPVPLFQDAEEPLQWLRFLDELLYSEDIPALQEFMGYALIPTNRAQVMMMIIGSGGEGKSRIALVLKSILGDNMNMGSIQKVAGDRFARADQEGKLLFVDDDMKMEALPDTGLLKTLVSLEDKYDIERKGSQSHQGHLWVRLLLLGNGSLSSLYDKSDGFYRRQLILKAKPKPADRVDDRYLIDKLNAEVDGIVRWCVDGLRRLCDNNFEFSVSERMKENLKEIKHSENNMLDFYESEGYIVFDICEEASSKELYEAYERWCDDNLEKPLSERTFSSTLKRDADSLGITYEKNIQRQGKRVRGYGGVGKYRPKTGFKP